MDSDNTDDVPGLAESAKFMTLSAQICKRDVDRVLSIIERETKAGRSPSVLDRELAKCLPDYDAHTRRLLLQIGAGGKPSDQFPQQLVKSSVLVKPGTLELELNSSPSDVSLFSIVFHKNTLWLMVEYQNNRCVLKELK